MNHCYIWSQRLRGYVSPVRKTNPCNQGKFHFMFCFVLSDDSIYLRLFHYNSKLNLHAKECRRHRII